jgi:hypothetical protein
MRRLAILLVAILLALSLVACGSQTEAVPAASPEPLAASASSVPSSGTDALMAQAKALAQKTNDLGSELWEGQMFEVVLAENAAAAKPELAKARAILEKMAANEKSIATLLDQVVELDVSEELTTYAGQQKEIAELQLQGIAPQKDLLAKIQAVYGEKGKVSQADLEKLFVEIEPSGPDDPLAHLEEKGMASVEYFRQSGLPERYYINNGFGEGFGTERQAAGEGFGFPVSFADCIQFEGPEAVEEAPREIWGSFEVPLEEAMQAQRSLLESEGWSVSLSPTGETRRVMTARKLPYKATLTFEEPTGSGAGKAGTVVVHLTEM